MRSVRYIIFTIITFVVFGCSVEAVGMDVTSNHSTITKGSLVNVTVTISSGAPMVSIEGTFRCEGAGVSIIENFEHNNGENNLYSHSFGFDIQSVNTGTITCSATDVRLTNMSSDTWNYLPDKSINIAVEEPNNATPVPTYTIRYNANGGEGAPNEQTKIHDNNITLSSTKPTRKGYTFLGWDRNQNNATATYEVGAIYSNNADVTLYAIWSANTYNIDLNLNGGIIAGSVSVGTYDQDVIIQNPTKTVKIVLLPNGTYATIGSSEISVDVDFTGWTSPNIDVENAYHDNEPWSDGNNKVVATTFRNLNATQGETVTMVANWEEGKITLPTVTKDDFICNWNTEIDGNGVSYLSGGEYIITLDSFSTVKLYAQCIPDSKPAVPDDNPETGNKLAVLAWLMGIGALGFSVYYFVSRKSNI